MQAVRKPGFLSDAFAHAPAYIIVHGGQVFSSKANDAARGAGMTEAPKGKGGWTAAEREALRKLIRMALILLLAIVIAGTIAALLSSALGTV